MNLEGREKRGRSEIMRPLDMASHVAALGKCVDAMEKMAEETRKLNTISEEAL